MNKENKNSLIKPNDLLKIDYLILILLMQGKGIWELAAFKVILL